MYIKMIEMADFLSAFNKEYKSVCDHRGTDFSETVDEFDNFYLSHKTFVRDFVKFRGDILSSDRECAAFMSALSYFE